MSSVETAYHGKLQIFRIFQFLTTNLPGQTKKIFILADGRLFQSQKKIHQYFKRAIVTN